MNSLLRPSIISTPFLSDFKMVATPVDTKKKRARIYGLFSVQEKRLEFFTDGLPLNGCFMRFSPKYRYLLAL